MDQRKYFKNIVSEIEDNGNYGLTGDSQPILSCTFIDSDTKGFEKKVINTLTLFENATDLLQIAEMYYDHMKSSGADRTIAFQMTEKVLKKLKSR